MDEMSGLAIVCERCGSSRIVPILAGLENRKMTVLALQERIELAGCYAGDVGSPLWGCVDCGEYVTDPRFVIQATETATLRHYHRTVKKILASYRPISDVELARLRGRSWIKTVVACEFEADMTHITIRPRGSGFSAYVCTDRGTFERAYDKVSVYAFKHMRAFATGDALSNSGNDCKETLILRVRVDGQDRQFRVPIIDSETTTGSGICVYPAGEKR